MLSVASDLQPDMVGDQTTVEGNGMALCNGVVMVSSAGRLVATFDGWIAIDVINDPIQKDSGPWGQVDIDVSWRALRAERSAATMQVSDVR